MLLNFPANFREETPLSTRLAEICGKNIIQHACDFRTHANGVVFIPFHAGILAFLQTPFNREIKFLMAGGMFSD